MTHVLHGAGIFTYIYPKVAQFCSLIFQHHGSHLGEHLGNSPENIGVKQDIDNTLITSQVLDICSHQHLENPPTTFLLWFQQSKKLL